MGVWGGGPYQVVWLDRGIARADVRAHFNRDAFTRDVIPHQRHAFGVRPGAKAALDAHVDAHHGWLRVLARERAR